MPKMALIFARQLINIFDLDQDEITIGRSPESDIVIDNPAVSRNHAKIVKEGNFYVIKDLDTVNGVTVNGRRVKSEPIKPGDEIDVGKHTIMFETEPKVIERPASSGVWDAPATWPEGTVYVDPIEMQKMQAKLKTQRGAHLQAKSGPARGKRVALGEQVVTVGKSEECDIQVKGFLFSPVQCRVSRVGNNYVVRHEGVFRPTRVNGSRIVDHMLQQGDIIQVGDTILQFFDESG